MSEGTQLCLCFCAASPSRRKGVSSHNPAPKHLACDTASRADCHPRKEAGWNTGDTRRWPCIPAVPGGTASRRAGKSGRCPAGSLSSRQSLPALESAVCYPSRDCTTGSGAFAREQHRHCMRA